MRCSWPFAVGVVLALPGCSAPVPGPGFGTEDDGSAPAIGVGSVGGSGSPGSGRTTGTGSPSSSGVVSGSSSSGSGTGSSSGSGSGASSSSSSGGSGSGTSSNGGGGADGGGADARSVADSGRQDASAGADAATLGFAANVQPIFSSYQCGGCHPNCGNLTVSYANMINVKSGELPTVNYVTPGDPGHSYTLCKVNPTDVDCVNAGTTISGSRMPPGGPYLQASEIAAIKNWILQGARP